jgi:hypothetical protein
MNASNFFLVQPSKVVKLRAPPKISMAAKKRMHTVASGGAAKMRYLVEEISRSGWALCGHVCPTGLLVTRRAIGRFLAHL